MPFVNGFNILNGQVQATTALPAPPRYSAAKIYNAADEVYVSTATPQGFVYNAPYRFAPDGALYISGGPINVYQGGLPFDGNGALCVSSAPGTGYINGWPSNGSGIAMGGSTFPPVPNFFAPLINSVIPTIYSDPLTPLQAPLYSAGYINAYLPGTDSGNLWDAIDYGARFIGVRKHMNGYSISEGKLINPTGTTPPVCSVGPYDGRPNVCIITFPPGVNGPVACLADYYYGAPTAQWNTAFGQQYRHTMHLALSRPLVGAEQIMIKDGQYLSTFWLMTAASQPTDRLIRYDGGLKISPYGVMAPYCYPNTNLLTPITMYLWGMQGEEVSGPNKNPSEYLSTGPGISPPAPFYGAGIDGLKFETTANGYTTVPGPAGVNIVVPGDGAPLPTAPMIGQLYEQATTNFCSYTQNLQGSPDWIKTGLAITATIPTDMDPTGRGYCQLMTASAANASMLMTRALTAGPAIWSVFFKRKTGTGPIILNLDGVDTDVTAQVNAANWTRPFVVKTVIAGNITWGVKLGVSGDAVWVFIPQLENPAVNVVTPSSPVLVPYNGPTSRGAENTQYRVGNTSPTLATHYMEATISQNTTNMLNRGVLPWNAFNQAQLLDPATNAFVPRSSAGAFPTPNGISFSVINKFAVGWSGATISGCLNGGGIAAGAYTPYPATPGHVIYPGYQLNGVVRNVKFYPIRLSDAQLQALTV